MSKQTPPEARTMNLGRTGSHRYIGFQPPLTQEELDSLPLPILTVDGKTAEWPLVGVEYHDDKTQDVGFDADAFWPDGDKYTDEQFLAYARKVAQHLGNCALDETVRNIGPGSVIAQANGTPANW